MKTSKSPESTEITPSKKKLKQARLPFKLISDVSPKPDAPQARKRKLSAPETESITKVGKISKENDVIEHSIVISDDDSKGPIDAQKDDKSMNPFVKLVDTAWKKKLQKSRKKKTGKKKAKSVTNGTVEAESGTESADNKEADCEMMDVDEVPASQTNGAGSDTEKAEAEPQPNKTQSGDEETNAVTVIVDEFNDAEDPESKVNEAPTDKEESEKVSNTTSDQSKDNNSSNTSPTKKPDSKPAEKITPKRSARNIAKAEQNNNSKGSPSTKLNDSVCSAPSTPKQAKTSRSSSVTTSQGDVSLNESTSSVNLTPKQAQKKLESAKKREEREKEKQERDKKKQQEKEERAKIRQEKEDQRKREREEKEEAKKKEREEKEEQKKKEREEKERQKELEKKQKEEKEEQKRKEREEKEEQKKKEKEAKDEEKRKKQEALEIEKQEQELKKKKAAEAFVNFFVPKQKTEKEQLPVACISKTNMLSNFMIKSDMRLAPLVRTNLSEDKKEDLVNYIEKQNVAKNGLYLKCLKDGTSKPLSSGKTWPLSDKDDDDDVMVVEDELPSIDGAGEILSCESVQREKLRPKLLSFHENRRPPYWGTWRKKSASVKPRRPFGQDEKQVDYEADSDEEWEEEQEGESIDGSAAGSDDDQDADEYEVDNVVFVPHGYLSDEEATMDEDDVLSLSPETQQQRLKHLENEFESEMKKPTEKLKPRMYGLLWETADGGKPEKCVDALWNYFGKMAMIMNDPTPLLQPASEPEETEKKKVKKKKPVKETKDSEPKQKSPKSEKKKKPKADDKEKTPKSETKKNVPEAKKNQPGINMFLTKLKST
ncbi:unnamed protein product [Chrysodeixis includens]|uniref:Uncharacterized protein n=1 Tax=Chrysodeixis includens TaxID=689277 RepID=A0A9P0FRE3_CHRIL|nr:unnamed protein product [Chrysodeixis includens]